MPGPIKIIIDDFKYAWDDNEENLVLNLTGEDGQEVHVTLEREMSEGLVTELAEFLGVYDSDDDDDD